MTDRATGRLVVRRISEQRQAAFTEACSASFLQVPPWARVKPGWRPENLGWFRADDEQEQELLGTALVLHRQVPGIGRSLAYVPEGPTIPWATVAKSPAQWLDPLIAHLRSERAFAVRIGPQQMIRLWSAPTAKRGLVDPDVHFFDDLLPDEVAPDGANLIDGLRATGWRSMDEGVPPGGFSTGQPRFRLRLDLANKTLPEFLAGTNQQWRRNITRAAKAGVVVREGNLDDIPVFHALYQETAERDGFTPRPKSYFEGMWQALAVGPQPHLRVYVAELGPEREPLACALMIQVGDICWYSYGASTGRHREAQASTALQWHAISAAHARGCHSYDMRGIADTLDPAHPLAGLVRFKLSTGGSCFETIGEWEMILSPVWYQAYRLYQRSH